MDDALDLLLDADGDLDLSIGDAQLVYYDAQGLAQRLQTRLRLYLAEWAFDVRAGVPWREQILVRGRDAQPARAVLTAQILSCPGVVGLEVLTIDLDPAARRLTFAFTALVQPPPTGLEDASDPLAVTGSGALASDLIELTCLVEGPGGYL